MTKRQITRRTFNQGVVATAGAAAGWRPESAVARTTSTLRIAMSGYPATLDPVLLNQTAVRRVVPQIFETLIAFDYATGMALKPALATRWERLSERAVRLALRPGVIFHDRSPFSADDVAFSLGPDHLLGPDRAGRVVALQTLGTLDRVEIVDPGTVIVHAKGPDALLEQRLAAWASQMVSKRAFEAAGTWEAWNSRVVGTGPYKLVEAKLDQRVRLAAHEGYWGQRAPYTEIDYRIVSEVGSRVNALLTGEADLITDVPPDQFPTIAARPELEVVGGSILNTRYLGIDTSGPLLGDTRIRRALSLAIDRKLIIDSLWSGQIDVPNGFQFASFGPNYHADFQGPIYDPDRARALLQHAGYRGEPIAYRLLNNYYTNQTATAQVLVEMWRTVGLRVDITMLENFSQVYKKPVNAIFDNSVTADIPDHLGHAWRSFGPQGELPRQVQGWANEEYFRLGQTLAEDTDSNVRRTAHGRMLEILSEDDPPAIILHSSGQFYGKRKDVPWIPHPTLNLQFGAA